MTIAKELSGLDYYLQNFTKAFNSKKLLSYVVKF